MKFYGFLFLFLLEVAQADLNPWESLEVFEKNQQSLSQLQSQDLEGALGSLVQGLSKYPDHPLLLFNLGFLYELKKEPTKALKIYNGLIESSGSGEIVFLSLFNSARIYAQEKKIDQALDFYQKALKIKPESMEVKTNIELLMQQNQGQSSSHNQQQQKQKDQEQKNQEQKNQDKQNQGEDQKDQKSPEGDQDESSRAERQGERKETF